MPKKPNNPFPLSGYLGKDYFCDRQAELATLYDHFENERNVVIYAWRRMGKTSLIRCFLAELEAAKKADWLYVDLLATRDIDHALQQIAQACYARFGKTSSGLSASFQKLLGQIGLEMSFDPQSGIPTFGVGLRSGTAPETSLDAIGTFLSERKSKVVIAIDEFQQIGQYAEQNGEAIFRAWTQSFPDLRFIFSGSHRTMMAAMFSEKKRPFYRSAQLMALEAIPLELYTPFIQKHFVKNGKTISPATIEKLYSWCRQQTYSVQLVCNKLYGKLDSAEAKDLPEVFENIIAQEAPIFAQYTNLLSNTQWNVLRAIARDEWVANPLSKKFLLGHNLGAASSVKTALTMLQKNELVIKEPEGYAVQDVLLARWIQQL